MKKTVATKSMGSVILDVVASIVLLLAFVVWIALVIKFPTQEVTVYIFGVFFGVSGIVLSFISRNELRKPKITVEMDDENLYIHYVRDTKVIKLSNIKHVTSRKTHARYITYTFGKLIVHTKEGEFKTDTVSQCEQAAVTIMSEIHSKQF